MEETSAYDLLIDYPRKHGLEFDTQDDYKRFYLFPTDSVVDTKFVVFKTGPFYFYAHDSYTTKLYMLKTFTGLYTTARYELPELKVHPRELMSSLMRFKKRKTGIPYIDNNLTITSDVKELSFNFTHQAVANFLDLAERFKPLHLFIKNNYINDIPDLKDKKIIGLETGQWLYKEEDVDLFIELGGEIIKSVS